MSAQIISIINQKGGVAKTVTVAHLAMALARKKKAVLCIDMDPQANLSMLLGSLENGKRPSTTIYDAMQVNSKQSLGTSYLDTRDELVKLCYGSLRMAGLERDLITARTLDPSRVLLKKIDDYVKEAFNYVLIDCPPSLSMLTINSLAASNYYIVPIPAGDSLALEGVEQLNVVIRDVQEQLNPDLQLLGVLQTRYDGRLNITKAMVNEILNTFGKRNIFKTAIHQNTLVEQAVHSKLTVFEHDGRAPAAQDYLALADEVTRRCKALEDVNAEAPPASIETPEVTDGEEVISA